MALVAIGLAASGCSYRLESLFFKDATDARAEVTGSIPAAPMVKAEPLAETDLAYARAVASEVVARTDKGASQTWENPNTGARGMVTPLAAAYESNGTTCRDFLASYVKDRSEVWLQGEACKFNDEKWEVREMRPWKRS